MCVNRRYIYNRYIGRKVLVSCGHCPACQQEKANARARRIKNHSREGFTPLFLTLTYSNHFVPYVISSELTWASRYAGYSPSVARPISIPIFRNCSCRVNSRTGALSVNLERSQIDEIFHTDITYCSLSSPELNKMRGCTGIIYYPDIQRFFKRLRINIKRKLDYEVPISYYACGEYGGKTFRPHFHVLLYIPSYLISALRPIIAASWPYGDMLRSDKRIQIAVNAASYVASYVNVSSSLPKVLTSRAIRQKHSASKYFGTNLRDFSLSEVLKKVDRGTLEYSVEAKVEGVPVLVNVPLPKYVINRYFPKFKGYFRFNDIEIQQLLLSPHRYLPYSDSDTGFNLDDLHKFMVRIKNAISYYIEVTGRTAFDYAIDYIRTWNCRFNTVFRRSYEGVSSFHAFYENILEYYNVRLFSDCPTLIPLAYRNDVVLNPNRLPDVVVRSQHLHELYNDKDKTRKVTNFALSRMYDDF